MNIGSTRSTAVLPLVAATLAAFQVIVLLAQYWPGGVPNTLTSGVWIGLADDTAHRMFYRPLWSEPGTGGTRYMPLFFLLHAGLIKLGFAPVSAGVALTLLSVGALLVAMVVLLRRLGVSGSGRWFAALLLLGTVSFQLMLLTVRGDFLAAALNLAGVAVTLEARERPQRRLLWFAAALFAAAFLTKLTTLFGLAAMVGWLLSQKEHRLALRLGGASTLLMVTGALLANRASEGRMLNSFRAVADGGITFDSALQGPVRFATECVHDPLSIVLFVTALIAGASLSRDARGRPVIWIGAITCATTLVIFLSPGTAANHLIDLQAAAVLVIAVALTQSGVARRWAGVGTFLLIVGMVATWIPGVPSIHRFFEREGWPRIAGVKEFYSRFNAQARPMLSEDPVIPIIGGDRPIVGDWFNLRLMWRNDPQKRREMLERVRTEEFGSVVLSNWPTVYSRDIDSPDDPLIAERSRALLERDDLPEGFTRALLDHYQVVLVRRPYIYLVRRDGRPTPSR